MPRGIPLATMPENGADRAALLAVRILALNDPVLAKHYAVSVQAMQDKVLDIDAQIQQDGWQKHAPK